MKNNFEQNINELIMEINFAKNIKQSSINNSIAFLI